MTTDLIYQENPVTAVEVTGAWNQEITKQKNKWQSKEEKMKQKEKNEKRNYCHFNLFNQLTCPELLQLDCGYM